MWIYLTILGKDVLLAWLDRKVDRILRGTVYVLLPTSLLLFLLYQGTVLVLWALRIPSPYYP